MQACWPASVLAEECGTMEGGARLSRLCPPDADAFRLDDQQVTPEVLLLKGGDPAEKESGFHSGRGMAGKSQHDNPMMRSKREPQKVRKAFIGGNQSISVGGGVLEHGIIARCAKPDVTNIIGRETSLPQGKTCGMWQVSIEEESDHRIATLTSSAATTSAAYRSTARRSSRVTLYSRAMSSIVVPAAISSRITATGTRVPLITG